MELKGYAAMISKAVNVTDPVLLHRIEDTMRNDIFHSTLDWQSARQFNKGAREALELLQYIDSPEGQAELAKMRGELAA